MRHTKVPGNRQENPYVIYTYPQSTFFYFINLLSETLAVEHEAEMGCGAVDGI
jgi:hypothetical protein